jgi:dihydroorotase-like cyclic amidohydrolase
MAHFYHYKIVMCRERSDAKAVGSLTYSEPSRTEYEFTHTNEEATATGGFVEFVTAVREDMVNSPQHVNLIDVQTAAAAGGVWAAAIAASFGASFDDSTVATEGAWSVRIGKDVYRHEVGYSAVDAAGALTNLTAKNLS